MMSEDRLARRKQGARTAITGLLLGGAGYLLNLLEMDLGWGLHLMFGNALIYAFLRVLPSSGTILAAAVANLRTIFLWQHPWAWVIWTLEAATLTRFVRRIAPLRVCIIFWVLVGTPLLVLTYGLIMGMDQLSLNLVIAKQAINAVLNMTLAELAYFLLLNIKRHRGQYDWPRMQIESLLKMILIAIILIPTTLYIRAEAPLRAQMLSMTINDAMAGRLQMVGMTARTWLDSRIFSMKHYVAGEMGIAKGSQSIALPRELEADFKRIMVISAKGELLWRAGQMDTRDSGDARQLADLGHLTQPRLVYLDKAQPTAKANLELLIPFPAAGEEAIIAARFASGTVQKIYKPLAGHNIEAIFFANSSIGNIVAATDCNKACSEFVEYFKSGTPDIPEGTSVFREKQFGTPLMNEFKDGLLVRASPMAMLDGWKAIIMASPKAMVLAAREEHLRRLTRLSAVVLLAALLGSLIAIRMEQSLRKLAQSAADLATLGTDKKYIDGLVIQELSDIATNILAVQSRVSHQSSTLANYQRRLNSIARHAPIVIYAVNVREGLKDRLVYVSKTISSLLGYSWMEVTAAGWWSHAVHPEDWTDCVTAFADLAPGTKVKIEYRLRHKQGHYIWVEDTLAVEVEQSSGQVEAVGLLVDITERKRASAQLLQADKMASLGRMVSGITHELNQPLNFIKIAALNLKIRLERGQFDSLQFAEKLESILAHIQRASTIIMHMRVFGRTHAENMEETDLRDIVTSVQTMSGPQLDMDDIELKTSVGTESILIRAMPMLLEQVLLNLILNARDAIKSRHATGDTTPGLITITTHTENGYGIVQVEDNGIGISSEILPIIFEPFFTTKPPREGTGLGLSISYGILHDLNGEIRAENISSGARFIIQLPIVKQS